MTKIIGLTGGIGSGKSTVARLLHKFGASVIDTDKLAHEMYQQGTAVWGKIVDVFGKHILTPDGVIDRTVLGQIVFNDAAALRQLNTIVHPVVLEQVQNLIEKYRKQNTPVVIVEAPLLIEAGWHNVVDEVWVTVAQKAKVVERLKKQRRLSEKEITARAHNRLTETQLLKHADVVIRNDGSEEQLKSQVADLWDRLTKNTA